MWGWIAPPKCHFFNKNQTNVQGDRTLLLHEKRYCVEQIITILWPYAIADFIEQLNQHNEDDDEITPMEKFPCKTTDITLKSITHGSTHSISWAKC